MKKTLKNLMLVTGLIMSVPVLSSCQAASAEIHHHDLNVESKMSNSIFLDPLDSETKTIFVETRNTSTENINGATAKIKDSLSAAGFTIVQKPQAASYILQVNFLQFGAVKDKDRLWKDGMNFDQSALTGAGAGLGTALVGGSPITSIGVGVAVAAGSWVANEMVENKAYAVITDIKISEQSNKKIIKTYNTRIISEADKVNLKFRDAKPIIGDQLAREITGIFASDND